MYTVGMELLKKSSIYVKVRAKERFQRNKDCSDHDIAHHITEDYLRIMGLGTVGRKGRMNQ